MIIIIRLIIIVATELVSGRNMGATGSLQPQMQPHSSGAVPAESNRRREERDEKAQTYGSRKKLS